MEHILKPCPFCGSEAEVGVRFGVMMVKCANEECGATIENGYYSSEEETIDLWNRRAQ